MKIFAIVGLMSLALVAPISAQVIAPPKAAELGADFPGGASAAQLIARAAECNAAAVTPEQPRVGRLRVPYWGGTLDEIASCEAVASAIAKRRH